MSIQQPLDIKIDKRTRSIENAITGDSFKTEILELTLVDIRDLKRLIGSLIGKQKQNKLTKLSISLLSLIIQTLFQGLISLQNRGDHIFMSLIESSKFNRGAIKIYLGVPGNLVAFACKLSFDKGYSGYVSFESKTKLKEHYQKTLGAHVLFGNIMAIDTREATKLVEQYFPKNL